MILPHLSKHKKKYIRYSVATVLLIVAFYLYLQVSATLHFNLQTEILITHEPKQYFISTQLEEVNVTIKTDVDTFKKCDIICDYNVEKVYYLINQTAKSLTHSFVLNVPPRGFGEQLYIFKSSCKTIPSTFCPSSNNKINQTTIIIINYTLTQSEQALYSKRLDIQKTLNNADEYLNKINYSNTLLQIWPSNAFEVPQTPEVKDAVQALRLAWEAENYAVASDLWKKLNESLTQITIPEVLVSQINTYNTLQQEIDNFTSNQTLSDYFNYTQEYESQVRTVRQAAIRLQTITRQTFIEDLTKSTFIAKGAIDYLATMINEYVSQKEQALLEIGLAKSKLPFIQSNIISLNESLCEAVAQLRNQNAWATFSGLLILNSSQLQETYTIVNATAIFDLPEKFCVKQVEKIDIPWTQNLISTQISIPAQTSPYFENLSEHVEKCYLGNDKKRCPARKPPILFIHGHAFDESNSPQVSMQAFATIQEGLNNLGYVNAGELDKLTSTNEIDAPITTRASYYYIKEYGIGDYSFEVQKSERLENYALRLKEIVSDVMLLSGSPNVTIVAHSMGGLVVREYASLFGYDSIDRVITINTPHQGIEGRTKKICSLIGAAKECEDMGANSTFFQRLPIIKGRWDVIASTGCPMAQEFGDGVVLQRNSALPGANYYLLNATCTDALDSNLHTIMLEQGQLFKLLSQILEK